MKITSNTCSFCSLVPLHIRIRIWKRKKIHGKSIEQKLITQNTWDDSSSGHVLRYNFIRKQKKIEDYFPNNIKTRQMK